MFNNHIWVVTLLYVIFISYDQMSNRLGKEQKRILIFSLCINQSSLSSNNPVLLPYLCLFPSFLPTYLLITHSLVLLSVLPNTQHSHSVMTLISLSHTLSLSNPVLSSLAQWLLCCSSAALPYPFLIGRVCACGVPFSV